MPEFERPVRIDGVGGGDSEPLPDVVEFGVARRRHGITAALAGLAALVLVAVGAPEPRPQPPMSASPVPTNPRLQPSPISITQTPVALDLPGEVTFVEMGPTGYTAVVAFDCTEQEPCTGSMAVSADRRHWTRRQLPAGALRRGTPAPIVLGHGVLLVESRTERAARRWHSRDGGLTWRAVSPDPAPVVPDASAGRLTVEITDQPARRRCGPGIVSIIRRDTGQRAALFHQPKLIACDARPFPDRVGRLWVAGIDPESGRPAVALSPDLGRTWQTTPLVGAGHHTISAQVVYAGTDVYVLAVGTEPSPRFAIFRHAPDGWSLLWRTTGQEPENLDIPIICSGGLLLAGWWGLSYRPEDVGLLFSRDHGRTWHLAEGKVPALTANAVSYLGSTAWLGWYSGSSSRPVFSADCRHWETLPVR